ncbi:di-trans,poly-cis-decaprenylcistransferase [Candidatus Parcubacteria bacterium]|jgi:undecaprenyl diphosphate synthase|nr:di-trans,poly-cis-decaprenylcistransferase [Candidatus Parcubacteria bacterium]
MTEKTLQHIGIILDGNRRWAKKRGLPAFQGHKKGFDNLKKVAGHAFDRGIKILTVYAFSTENWKRDKKEVAYLMDLFRLLVDREAKDLVKRGVRLNILGRIEDFDKDLQAGIQRAIDKTKDGKKGVLNVCLSYGGRDEILTAVKKIIKDDIKAEKVDEKLFSRYLYTTGLPDPELIIRTSGEQRLSGFLTWQSVYSELYFPKTTWPSFGTKDLDKAIDEFNDRSRRFGGN